MQKSTQGRGQFEMVEDDVPEQKFDEGLSFKPKIRVPKTQISQAVLDERKRQELETILEEQHKKMKDKQDKLRGIGQEQGDKFGGGILGRFVSHNTK